MTRTMNFLIVSFALIAGAAILAGSVPCEQQGRGAEANTPAHVCPCCDGGECTCPPGECHCDDAATPAAVPAAKPCEVQGRQACPCGPDCGCPPGQCHCGEKAADGEKAKPAELDADGFPIVPVGVVPAGFEKCPDCDGNGSVGVVADFYGGGRKWQDCWTCDGRGFVKRSAKP